MKSLVPPKAGLGTLNFLASLRSEKIGVAKGKFTEKLVKLRCDVCKRLNYYKRKNKKTVERKLEFKKFCKWCRKHTVHKEAKK